MNLEELLVIESDRDRRALEYLINQCGEDQILDAINHLSGNRRAYISNIAKLLSITIPKSIECTPSAVARVRLSEIKSLISSRS